MSEHDEQHIIAKQPTLLERLRLTDPEAAQAIERLEGDRTHLKALVHVTEERTKKAERELEIVTASLTDQETENGRLREQLAEVRAREGRQRKLLDELATDMENKIKDGHETCGDPDAECPLQNAGKPWSTAGLLKKIREALATPAPIKTTGKAAVMDPTPAPMDELQRLGQEYDAAPSTGEAERRVVEAVKPLANFVKKSVNAGPRTSSPRSEAVMWREVHDALDALAAQQQESGE